MQVASTVVNIHTHPTQVVSVSKRGDVIALNYDLNISNELGREDEDDRLLRSFSYPRAKCTFLQNDISVHSEIIVLFLTRNDTVYVRVLGMDQEHGIIQIASVPLTQNTASRIQPLSALVLNLCRQSWTSHSVDLEILAYCVCDHDFQVRLKLTLSLSLYRSLESLPVTKE